MDSPLFNGDDSRLAKGVSRFALIGATEPELKFIYEIRKMYDNQEKITPYMLRSRSTELEIDVHCLQWWAENDLHDAERKYMSNLIKTIDDSDRKYENWIETRAVNDFERSKENFRLHFQAVRLERDPLSVNEEAAEETLKQAVIEVLAALENLNNYLDRRNNASLIFKLIDISQGLIQKYSVVLADTGILNHIHATINRAEKACLGIRYGMTPDYLFWWDMNYEGYLEIMKAISKSGD